MNRTGNNRGTRFALLLLAAWQVCACGQGRAWSQAASTAPSTAPSTQPPANPPSDATPGPTGQAPAGTLAVDVAHPDRTPGEKPRQGLAGELTVAAPRPDIPGVANGGKSATVPPLRTATTAVSDRLPTGSAIRFRLSAPLSSARQHNGDAVQGTLAAPLTTAGGKLLAPGTPVVGTIVSSTPAGTIQSGGVLSLQLTQVGGIPVVTDVRDFDGQPGHKDVADSAPQKGTEAVVNAGAIVPFQVVL